MPDPCSGRRWQLATLPTRRAWAAANQPCALCHQPINYGLRHPHKRSLTVDHIHARWAGGNPMDPANWQPAHLSCNSSRGASETNARRGHHPIGSSAPWPQG